MPIKPEDASQPAGPDGAVGVLDRFPVTVRSRDGLVSSSVRGWGEHLDQQGVRIRTDKPLPRGRKVRIDFDAPPDLTVLNTGMSCRFPAEVLSARETSKAGAHYEMTLKWEQPLPELVSHAEESRYKKLGVLLLVVLAFTLWLRWTAIAYFWYDPVLYFYSTAIGLFYYSRFYLAFIHKGPKYNGYEPTLSIVIAVRNDEEAIRGGVASCFAADYPDHKREVIVVNDGSTDGTAKTLAQLEKKFPELRVFHIPPSGKRFGMAKGIREAKGEIIVVIDSDTSMERMALRHIVQGFDDPSLGAVSGYTGVTNADKNLLTRMQEVRYLVSFELMKAPESVFGCVSCCPGCLSAYRKKYLLDILDEWLAQKFMGLPATFGDDRSLTNYILRRHRVIYNPLARSTTVVPENWPHYMRQQCRWKKSWLRESTIIARILARKHPVAALSFYVSAMCSLLSPAMVFRIFWWDYNDQVELMIGYLVGMMLLGLSMGLFALWKRPTKNWPVTWFWIATQILLMGPQTYYALLTLRKNHWGTR